MFVLVAAAGAWLLVDGGGSTRPASQSASPPTTRHVAQPAGPDPSVSAQMVCGPEAVKDIATTLGATIISPLQPTWVAHLYSCRYVYPGGSIAVSVKELPNRAQTAAYFSRLRDRLGQHRWLKGTAQGAFTTNDGSFVLRKDYKVLLVDTTALPAHFGTPLMPRAQVSLAVGITLLGCWTGA